MNTAKKRIFYSLYTICAIIFFLYILFPSEKIKQFIEYKVSSTKPGYTAEIQDIKPAFPPGLTLYSASIFNIDGLLVDVDKTRIIPSLLSLTGSAPEFKIKANAYNGTIDTKVKLNKDEQTDSPGIAIESDSVLQGIKTGQITALQDLSDYIIDGNLGGKIIYKGTGKKGVADADIIISDCNVELKTPFFNLKSLTFSQIDAKMTLHNFQNLQLKETIIKGNQAGGNISGTITLKKPSGKSILNLSGTITPQPALISKLGGMAAMFLKQKQGNKGFPFKITGTLEKPRFSLK